MSYHRVIIAKEDNKKTTFTKQWGSYAYHVMSFGLKNVSTIFSRIMIPTFKEYIHRSLEVYMDEWKIYILLKKHSSLLRMMFDHCRQLQISLKFKKFVLSVAFGTLLGHIACKDRVCIDPTKVLAIVNMEPPTNYKQLKSTSGHTRYYRILICNYTSITVPMEKLLRKAEAFTWLEECQAALSILKENMVSALILFYPNINK